MEIRLLGAHDLETRDTRHTCFLIDGHIAVDAGSLVRGLTANELEGLTAVFLTHHHFDHTRDIPTLGLVRRHANATLDLWGLAETLAGVHNHMLDGDVYPDLTRPLSEDPPRFRPQPLAPWSSVRIDGLDIKAIPMPHPLPAVGYIIRPGSGPAIAITGDTGGDLMPFFRDPMGPQVMLVDMTFPNRLRSLAKLTGHLTPQLLRDQVVEAKAAGLRIPRLVGVHRGLGNEEELIAELAAVRRELGIDLSAGQPGLVA